MVKLEIDGSQSRTELDNLTRKAQVLQDGLKGMKKGSEEYVAQSKEISQVNARMGELRDEIGITSLSYNQLNALTRQLNRELTNLVPGTEAFAAKSVELQQVQARLEVVRANMRGLADELGRSTAEFTNFVAVREQLGLVNLPLSQLKGLVTQLGGELNELTPGTEEFISKSQELQQADARLSEVRTAAKGVAEALESATSEVVDFVKLRDQVGTMGLSLGQLKGLASQLGDELDDLTPGTLEFIQKSQQLQQVDARLEQVRKEAKGVGDEFGNAGGGVGEFIKKAVGFAGIQLGVEAVVDSVKEIGKEIFNTTAKFETFEAVLTTALGDKSAAQYAMQQISDLAAKTPFSVDELTASYVKFVNRGIVPSTAEMQKLADVAASQGKSFDQLTEAVLDAGTGEFERLKEFGIQAKKSGDQVELSFKGVTKSVENTPQAINAALVGFGELNGVMGSTASISATLDGQTSNLGDTVDQLEVQVGKGLRPAFVLLLNAAGQFLDFLKNSKGPLSQFINYFIDLYNQSLAVRLVVVGLGVGFQNAYALIKGVLGFLIADLVAAGKVIKGVFTLDFGLIKEGYAAGAKALVDAVKGTGSEIGQNYKNGFEKAVSTDKVALLGVSETDSKAAAASFEKAADRIRAAGDQKKMTDAAKKEYLEQLKDREANIRVQLASVAAGSAEELRLKKLDTGAKRDIELADEKKTASERKVIRADAAAAIKKLEEDFQKKQSDQAKKAAAEQVEVEKKIGDLKAALLTDESEKKLLQLRAAAEKEMATAKGTAEQIAEQRSLIQQKLAVDEAEVSRQAALKRGQSEIEVEKLNNSLIKDEFDRKDAEILTAHKEALLKLDATDVDYNAKVLLLDIAKTNELIANDGKRVAKHQEVADALAAIDRSEALEAAQRAKNQGDLFSSKRDEAAAKARDLQKADLQAQYDADMANTDLTDDQKRIKKAQFDADMRKVDQDYLDWSKMTEEQRRDFAFAMAQNYVQGVADLFKASSDAELKKLDKDKAKRLASLDAEYKAGKISKEVYEAQKSDIEANYNEKTRIVKKEAAEKEKVANIAQSIIAGVLAVIKAGGPFTPTGALTAIAAGLATAKIIATPIPEFEKGGFFTQAGRAVQQSVGQAWRGVRHYATGGRINARAGVADVGQRHSNGGIRMVDGATGQHLGEWEKGEAYMILSRDTYANNKHLVDELIDTSLYRGGAPVRRQDGFYEDGGVSGGPLPSTGSSSAGGQGLVQAVERVEAAVRDVNNAVRDLPSRQHIAWGQEDTLNVEDALNDVADDRRKAQIR